MEAIKQKYEDVEIMEKLAMQTLQIQAACELARRSFWEYCKLRYPKLYTDDKKYLKEICTTLQEFHEKRLINPNTGQPYDKLMLNAPPRHFKTLTLSNFSEWVLGSTNSERFICGCYNKDLSIRFGKKVRDTIQATKYSNSSERLQTGKEILKTIVYNDIFPKTSIKKGDGSSVSWALARQYFNFLSTSPGGTVTGVGCSYGLLDDLVKNKEEAYSDNALDKAWEWYTDTFISRLEEGAKQIILMTRWSKKDICGRILDDKKKRKDWYLLTYKAYDPDRKKKMLCKSILSRKSYEDKKEYITPEIIEANYNQKPIDIQGALYKDLKTYDKLPKDSKGNLLFDQIRAYIDTADEGKDYLCGIVYGVHEGYAYILDVLYTTAGMEVTEPLTAEMLNENEVNRALIESNNGGRGFSRNVQKILKVDLKNELTYIKWFHQTNNKLARILSNSTIVMNRILFPAGWENKLPIFYRDVMGFKKEGGNANDDAQDCLTGIAEDISKKSMEFG